MGSVDPEGKNQIHDFSPGIASNNLFWTIRIPDDAVTVDIAKGTAELHVQSLDVTESYTFPNSLQGGPSAPATVSVDVYWHDPTGAEQIIDTAASFAGTFLNVTSSMSWSAQSADFAYVSDPAATSQSLFGQIGFEANGVFMPTMGTPTP